MKAILVLIMGMVIGCCPAFSQIQKPVEKKKTMAAEQPVTIKPVVKSKIISSADTVKQPVTPTTTQPATQPQTTTTSEPPAYYIVAAKVRIKTGNDNKELQSAGFVRLKKLSYLPGGASPQDFHAYPGETLLFEVRNRPSEELKVNSTTEIDLSPIYGWNYHPDDIMIGYVETYGFKLEIDYRPNFLLDAWKIDNVVVVMEIKDRNGNPHPYLGYKEIMFSPNKLLKKGDNLLELFIDKNFMRKI